MHNKNESCCFIPSANLHDAFAPLIRYLGALRSDGYRFRMWWRDDDAFGDTPELRRLLLARKSVPVALAVVPGLLDTALVKLVDSTFDVYVLQHGWKHLNWMAIGSRPSEFPEFRSRSEVSEELRNGFDVLITRFNKQFVPVFVPPWHSCPLWILDNPINLGYLAISREAPLFPLLSRGGAQELNIEIDTSDWTKNGAFVGHNQLTKRIIRAFEIRRKWNSESVPIGLLTHHALLTQADCDCLTALVRLLTEFDTVEWVAVTHLLTRSP